MHFFSSGYMLLECNLTECVCSSDILRILVRLRFVWCCGPNKGLNVT